MYEIRQLIAGFAKFRRQYYAAGNQEFEKLKVAQSPSVLVIACSDSRVDPAILLDAVPGQLFVVRNVANLVPPHSPDGGTHGVSAALEFAVCVLKVRHIIVLGHSQCGGIQALQKGTGGEFISQWMNIASAITADIAQSGSAASREYEQKGVLLSLGNLKTFPWIADRTARGEIFLHGWYFDIGQGALEGFNRESGRFEKLDH